MQNCKFNNSLLGTFKVIFENLSNKTTDIKTKTDINTHSSKQSNHLPSYLSSVGYFWKCDFRISHAAAVAFLLHSWLCPCHILVCILCKHTVFSMLMTLIHPSAGGTYEIQSTT